MQAAVNDTKGEIISHIELPEKVFAVKPKLQVLHEMVTGYLANKRAGTASTKTKAEVSGGGHKPWKQKHTGRARAGSTRSPLWRHGGITFGPKPRDWNQDIPAKKRRLAINMALSLKAAEGNISVVDDIESIKGKTRDLAGLLKRLKLTGERTILVVDNSNMLLKRAARNIESLDIRTTAALDAYVILRSKKIIFTAKAIDLLRN